MTNREYFIFHQTNASIAPRFGLPSQSQTTGKWFIPISKRVDDTDGSFAGVIVATIDIDHLVKYIETFGVNEDNAFALMREDGGILLRLPLDPKAMGSNIADTELYRNHIMKVMRGNYEYISRFDGQDRIGGFYRSRETGVTAIATRTKQSILFLWLNQSKYPWLSIIFAYLIGMGLAIRWVRQIELREIGEQKVVAREAEFRMIASLSLDVIEKISIEGVREYVSPAAEKLFDQRAETLLGTNILDTHNPEDRAAWRDALNRIKEGSTSESVLTKRQRADGSTIWLESVLSCTHDESSDAPDAIVVITRDVTRQQKLKLELDALATTDGLTGLYNKRHFNAQLDACMAKAKKLATPLSLLMIDLDRFKLYNDTYGHRAGDNALRDVAAAIQVQLSNMNGLAARYGGEELVVLLPNCGEGEARKMAEAIRNAVVALGIGHAHNLPWGQITISLGFATALPSQPMTESELIDCADRALYIAKTNGRNQSVSGHDAFGPKRLTASA
ncbi:diguanylate cyclase [Rhizobium oryzicola]|uniref:diguanylate cyclase n=1 Tax=Rhizobium oryzicola TaxID=1232668 RepID=A0ABT8SVT4_9HYPH|nr:diguanylate cyclase [Rhizobium oryzicola]MDO1581993.1 diguanylate cyclase [Rhizobium oryzicola]